MSSDPARPHAHSLRRGPRAGSRGVPAPARGPPVKLERIPLEILLLLAERPGQLVTREQIAERIWGKDAFLDVDNSLNGAIRKIRQVLKDDPEQPRFIQTVTGRGYRFVAPVLDPADAPPEQPGPRRREPAPPRRRSRGPWLALAAALPLLLAGPRLVSLGGHRTARAGG